MTKQQKWKVFDRVCITVFWLTAAVCLVIWLWGAIANWRA